MLPTGVLNQIDGLALPVLADRGDTELVEGTRVHAHYLHMIRGYPFQFSSFPVFVMSETILFV